MAVLGQVGLDEGGLVQGFAQILEAMKQPLRTVETIKFKYNKKGEMTEQVTTTRTISLAHIAGGASMFFVFKLLMTMKARGIGSIPGSDIDPFDLIPDIVPDAGGIIDTFVDWLESIPGPSIRDLWSMATQFPRTRPDHQP